MASRLHRSGWLVKRGQVVKNWKSRWFVLDPDARTLTYYTDETGFVAKGAISVRGGREQFAAPPLTLSLLGSWSTSPLWTLRDA